MKKESSQNVLGMIFLIYFLCFIFRGVEYMFIRTDQSFFGEAFIHKLLGIAILFAALKWLSVGGKEIGFQKKNSLKNILYGLGLGAGTYSLAYGVDFFVQFLSGNQPSLRLFVSSYSIDGNLGNQTGLLFFIICILGNIINVVMEEGVFRGLFLKMAEDKYSFFTVVLLSSALFGLWHIAAPLRSFLDEERSLGGTLMMMLMLVFTTGLGGVKFCLLTKISGSLWFAMGDHFFNNTIINILHISAVSGADGLQTVRITIAQTVSFLIVLLIFCKGKFWEKETFRPLLRKE